MAASRGGQDPADCASFPLCVSFQCCVRVRGGGGTPDDWDTRGGRCTSGGQGGLGMKNNLNVKCCISSLFYHIFKKYLYILNLTF